MRMVNVEALFYKRCDRRGYQKWLVDQSIPDAIAITSTLQTQT